MSRRTRSNLLVFFVGVFVPLLSSGRAEAAPDYALDGDEWNGLSALVGLGMEAGVPLRTPTTLDLATTAPEDAILLVHPTRALPLGSLSEFVKRGGRLAVADDFGVADALLAVWGMRRVAPSSEDPPRLRGNQALLLALPPTGVVHPLSENVRALITNHPAALEHETLEPVFAFGPSREALVLSGSVGDGRVVAVADPSVLINNMLQFRGNREFARNLLELLEGGRGGRVYLITGDTPIFERVTGGRNAPPERLRELLNRLAAADLPPMALQIASLLLLALLVLVTSSTLPRRSPYREEWLLPAPPDGSGYGGRLAFFAAHPAHLLHPALAYRAELLRSLRGPLGLGEAAPIEHIEAALRGRGIDARTVRRLGHHLRRVQRLEKRASRTSSLPRIRPKTLADMVETGERVLERLAGATKA